MSDPGRHGGDGDDRELRSVLKSIRERERYGDPLVAMTSDGADVYVVSDLHLAAGVASNGTSDVHEKFFADDAFARMLVHFRGHSRERHRGAVLVLNGDIVDFLRITQTPSPRDADALLEWKQTWQYVGDGEMGSTRPSARERRYGFNTEQHKSVWKLLQAIEGHPGFFDALARWVGDGDRLVVVKGNHDVEWFWPAVRQLLRLKLAELARRYLPDQSPAQTLRTIDGRLLFVDKGLVIDGRMYVEHGNAFDPYGRIDGEALLPNGRELNLPVGSFFNRYILNYVEFDYPFTDNVRPRQNVLPLLIREHLPSALKMLVYHVPAFIVTLPKAKFGRIYLRAALVAGALLLPIVALLATEWPAVRAFVTKVAAQPSASASAWQQGLLASFVSGGLQTVLALVASYLLARFVSAFQLAEPDYLTGDARRIYQSNKYRFITFGHTHNPDCAALGSLRRPGFFNTGTWVPIIETSTAEVREDRTYTFLRVDSDGKELVGGALLRWNDDANRPEPATVMRRPPGRGGSH